MKEILDNFSQNFKVDDPLFFLIEIPHGFACLIITVPVLLGKDFEIVKAAKISLWLL